MREQKIMNRSRKINKIKFKKEKKMNWNKTAILIL